MEMAVEARRATGWQIRSSQPEALSDAAFNDNADRPMPCCREKLLSVDDRGSVPQTDTGRQGEKPQVRERNHVKELGKIAP